MLNRPRSLLLALLVTQTLTGCRLNPPLAALNLPVTTSYHGATTTGAIPAWRHMLPDPALQQLVELALGNNRDLRHAALNVASFKSQQQLRQAAQLPTLEASANLTRQRQSSPAAPTGALQQQSSISLGLTAFELDLFGRLESLSAAAQARYLSSVQGQRAARLALIAAVAQAYLELAQAQAQVQLGALTLQASTQIEQLIQRLHAARQRSGLDLAQAASQVASAQAEVAARERGLQQARNQLELLLGCALPPDLALSGALQRAPVLTQLPAGLPSDLLTRRPDIMQAEQELLAAHADIGAARAAFFPRIALTATAGYSSADMGQLFQGSNRSWSFAPQLSLPVFQRGQLQAELSLAEVRQQIAVVQYERSIQTAFREVNDALAGQQTYRQQLSAQQQLVASAQQRHHLLVLRLQAGLNDRLELLDAQRQLYSAQSTLLELQRDQFKMAVTLYQALGGGLE